MGCVWWKAVCSSRLTSMPSEYRLTMDAFQGEDERGAFTRQRVVLTEEGSARAPRVLGTSGGRKHSFRGAGLLPEGEYAWIWDASRHLGDPHFRLHIIEVDSGDIVADFAPGGDPTWDAAFSKDGARFLCCRRGS